MLSPHLMGHSRALCLTATGSTLPASSPQFGDLFHELLPSPQEVLPRALDLAEHRVAQTSMVSDASDASDDVEKSRIG
jgi:enoyl-CoA hydratase/carnithine racemase